MSNMDYYSEAGTPHYEDYMPTYEAHGLSIDLLNMLEQEGASQKAIDMAEELVHALYNMNKTADDKEKSMTDTSITTGYPERYNPGPHVSPTMDENRRRRTIPKRK
jgi:hypothetical protein